MSVILDDCDYGVILDVWDYGVVPDLDCGVVIPREALLSLIFLMIFNLCPRGIPIYAICSSSSSRIVSRSSIPSFMNLSMYFSNFKALRKSCVSLN